MKFPTPPKAERNRRYRSTHVELPDKFRDGSTASAFIINSRNSAAAFIINFLYELNFPMAQSQWKLDEYRADPEIYDYDMRTWYESIPAIDDIILDFMARGKYFHLSYESTLEEAIQAYRNAEYVDSLVYDDGFDYYVYNGCLYYDEDTTMWRAEFDTSGLEDRDFEIIKGTHVETF